MCAFVHHSLQNILCAVLIDTHTQIRLPDGTPLASKITHDETPLPKMAPKPLRSQDFNNNNQNGFQDFPDGIMNPNFSRDLQHDLLSDVLMYVSTHSQDLQHKSMGGDCEIVLVPLLSTTIVLTFVRRCDDMHCYMTYYTPQYHYTICNHHNYIHFSLFFCMIQAHDEWKTLMRLSF